MKRKYVFCLVLTPLLVALDQVTKARAVAPDLNRGGLFGWLQGESPLFVLAPALAIACSLRVLYRLEDSQRSVAPVIALVLAGLVGNAIDRLRLGYVIDFLCFYHVPTFNLADLYLVIGIALLIAHSGLICSTPRGNYERF